VKTVKVLDLPNFCLKLCEMNAFRLSRLRGLNLRVERVEFETEGSFAISNPIRECLKLLRSLHFQNPINVHNLDEYLTESMPFLRAVYLTGRELVPQDLVLITQHVPKLQVFASLNDGYFRVNAFNILIGSLLVGSRIHRDSLSGIPANNVLNRLVLCDCAEVPSFRFFSVYSQIRELYLDGARHLDPSDFKAAGFRTKLKLLTLKNSSGIADELLRVFMEENIILEGLIVPLNPNYRLSPGFTTYCFGKYLSWEPNNQLTHINVQNHTALGPESFYTKVFSEAVLQSIDLAGSGADNSAYVRGSVHIFPKIQGPVSEPPNIRDFLRGRWPQSTSAPVPMVVHVPDPSKSSSQTSTAGKVKNCLVKHLANLMLRFDV
jgi:hypothetical protein